MPARAVHPNARDVNAMQRAILAIELRAQKLPFHEIAKRAGYANATSCRRAILREMQRQPAPNVEHLREEELNILDMMQAKIWPQFEDEKNKGNLFAADRILKIIELRMKLMGLEMSPEQASISNTIVIREAPKELLESMNAPSIEMIEKEK